MLSLNKFNSSLCLAHPAGGCLSAVVCLRSFLDGMLHSGPSMCEFRELGAFGIELADSVIVYIHCGALCVLLTLCNVCSSPVA